MGSRENDKFPEYLIKTNAGDIYFGHFYVRYDALPWAFYPKHTGTILTNEPKEIYRIMR